MSITDELREWVTDHYSGWKSKQAEGIAIADRIDAEHERQLGVLYRDMSDAEWVRLPKDADGEYIRIGDVMEKPDGYKDRLFAVDGMILYSDRWTVQGFTPCKLHHHAPTVEDVLREFLNEAEHFYSLEEERGAIAQYAAKLQLAGDVE